MLVTLREIAPYLGGIIASVGAWFGGKSKAHHDRVADNQTTIDLLIANIDKNMKYIVDLQNEIIKLHAENMNLKISKDKEV